MSDILNVKSKLNWEPQKNYTSNTYVEAVDNDMEEILEHKQTLQWNNISNADKTVINEFSKRDDLVFTKADKGGATVILGIKNYIEKANKELNNEYYYKELNHNLIQEHTRIINNTIETFQQQLVLLKNISDN